MPKRKDLPLFTARQYPTNAQPAQPRNWAGISYTQGDINAFYTQGVINDTRRMYEQYRNDLQNRLENGGDATDAERNYNRWRADIYGKARAGAATPYDYAALQYVMGQEAKDNIRFGASDDENRMRYYSTNEEAYGRAKTSFGNDTQAFLKDLAHGVATGKGVGADATAPAYDDLNQRYGSLYGAEALKGGVADFNNTDWGKTTDWSTVDFSSPTFGKYWDMLDPKARQAFLENVPLDALQAAIDAADNSSGAIDAGYGISFVPTSGDDAAKNASNLQRIYTYAESAQRYKGYENTVNYFEGQMTRYGVTWDELEELVLDPTGVVQDENDGYTPIYNTVPSVGADPNADPNMHGQDVQDEMNRPNAWETPGEDVGLERLYATHPNIPRGIFTVENIKEYEDARQRLQNREETLERQEAEQNWINEKNPGWRSAWITVKNVPRGLLGGIVGTADSAITQAQGKPVDWYSVYQQPGQMKKSSTSYISNEVIKDPNWSQAYQLGASGLDSLVVAGLSAVGVPAWVGAVAMGGNAAQQTMLEAKDRGLDDQHAVWTGVAAGVAETFFEKVSLDHFIKLKPVTKQSFGKMVLQWAKNTGKQAFVEGTEEVFTDIANHVWDRMYNGGLSEYETNVRRYQAQGYSEKDAREMATTDFCKQLGMSFAGGAVLGGLMGGIGTGINTARYNMKANSSAKSFYGVDSEALVQEALELDPNNKTAQAAQKRLQQGKELSGATIWALVEQNEARIKENSGRTEASAPTGANVTAQRYGELGNGGRAMYETVRSLAPELSDVAFRDAFTLAYETGRATAQGDAERGLQTALETTQGLGLSAEIVQYAYNAGREDVIWESQHGTETGDSPSSVSLAADSFSLQGEAMGTEKGVNTYGTEGQQSVRVRDGGQRADGAYSGRQSEAVVGNAGEAAAGRGRAGGAADGGAARVYVAEKVRSSADLIGPTRGSSTDRLRLVTGNLSPAMEKAAAQARSRGLTAYFYTGGYMTVDGEACRGFIRDNVAFLRADDPNYTADQVMRHEAGHDAIAKHEIEPAEVYETLLEKYGQEGLDAILGAYAEDYAGSGMTADQIWEEVVCDSLGDMGVFAGDLSAVAPKLAEVLEGVKDETRRQGTRRALEGRGQKNPTAGEGSGKMSLVKYSEKQRENWGSSKSIVLYENETQLRDFIEDAKKGTNLGKKLYFGSIPRALAIRIKADTGLDAEGYNCSIAAQEIRKIFKDHGDANKENLRGQRAVMDDDIVNIPTVIESPDQIRLEPKLYNGRPVISFVKNLNGRTTVTAYLSGKHFDLTVQTMFAGKNKRNLSTPTGNQVPVNTPKASSGTVPTNSIPNSTQKSNPQNVDGHKSRVTERENAMPAAWRQNAERIEQEGEDGKWQYPGITQRTDALEQAVKGANTERKVEAAYRGLRQHDAAITAEIEAVQRGDEPDGDLRLLMGERRRTRLLLRQLTQRGENLLNGHKSRVTERERDAEYAELAKDPEKNAARLQEMVDEAAKAAGYTQEAWHQTGAVFTRFNTDNELAGRTDTDTPTGLFFKPNADDIRIGGNRQMHVFLSMGKTLNFANRNEAHAHWMKNAPGYAEDQTALDAVESEYKAQYEKAEEEWNAYYQEHYDTLWNNADSMAGLDEIEKRQDRILAEWKSAEEPIRLRMKRKVTAYMRASDYDSMHLKVDGMRYGKNVESFIIFNNTGVKSADPVTYDDSGNVIPLSERFNTAKDDIRFSRVGDSMETLQQENEALRTQVKEFQKALKATERKLTAARESRDNWKNKATFSPERVGREIIKTYDGSVSEAEIHEDVKKLIDYAARKDGITYEEMKRLAAPVAARVVKSAAAVTNGEAVQTWEDMKKHLRQSRIKVSQAAINDFTEWGAFWRKNGRRLNLVTGKDGAPIDVAYAELGEKFGYAYFPSDITHPADQLRRIAEIYDNLLPVFENPYSLNMAMAAERCANDLVDMAMGEVARGYKATYAGQLQEQVYQSRQYTQRLLEKERARSDERVKELKKHWQEQRRAEIEGREDSELRTRLLNVAKRLKNRKLPTVSRALLNQYAQEMLTEAQREIFDKLDTESKGMRKSTREGLEWLRDQYETLKDTDPNFIPDPATEERIKRLSRKQIDSLSHQDVVELTYALLNIENEIRNEKKLIDSAEKRDLFEAGLQAMDDIRNAPGSKASGVSAVLDRFIVTETLSPMRQVRRMVGYADGDPLLVATRELADGQRRSFDYKMRAQKRFQSFVDDKAFMESIAGKKAKTMTIRGIGENGPAEVEITPAMKISLYLHSRNNQSLTHIAGGGIRVPDMALYRKGSTEAYSRGLVVKLEPRQVKSLAAELTAREKQFADAVYDYFNTMSKSEINAVSEKLLGYPVAEVENYFPINTDDKYLPKEFESIKYDGSVSGMGFLNERINSDKPINLLDVDHVLRKSIDQHAKYVGLGVPVRNFNKLWGVTAKNYTEEGAGADSSVQSLVDQQWGETGRKYIEKMMSDLQTGGKEQNVWGKALSSVRSHYAGAVLTLNASVAMKQAASYPTAAAVVGWGPLAKAFKSFGKVDLELIAAYTPLQWYRSQGYSTQELGDMAKRGVKLPPWLNWVQGMDVLTTRKLWKAAEIYVSEQQPGLKKGSAEDIREGRSPYYKAVAEVYDRIIEETQPNYTTMQRPQLLRSDDTLMQNLQMFKTQPFQNFNILYDAMGELQARERAWKVEPTEKNAQAVKAAKKKAALAVTSQAAQLAVFAGMTLLWNAFRGKWDKYKDDEDDVTFLSILKGVGLDMIGGLFSEIPFGGDAWDFVSAKLTGGKYYGVDDVTTAALSDALKALSNAGSTVSGLLTGDIKDFNTARLKLDGVADAVTKVMGVPYENVLNLGNAVFRIGARALEGDYMGQYRYLQLTTSPEKTAAYYDLLFEAYRKDPAAHKELYTQMVADGWDPDKIKSAMETRMKKAEGVSSVKDLKSRYTAP